MRKILCLAILSASLTGCASLNPFAALSNPPSQPKKVANWVQTEDVKPVYIGKDQAGKDIIANEVHRTYTAGSEEIAAPITFMQRLGRWIGGLGISAIIFIVISLAIFGGTPIVWAVKKYYTMRAAFKNTIAAIDEIPQDTFDKEVAPKLRSELDEAHRKIIKKLKTEI